MRKIKNEFMSHWDGLTTKQGERILVLAATNRPFDLDEAIIRRFERRYLNYFKKLSGSIIVHGLNRRETDNLSTKLKIFS
jgi:ATP-dependent Zn protease